jgi:hypothetical protein
LRGVQGEEFHVDTLNIRLEIEKSLLKIGNRAPDIEESLRLILSLDGNMLIPGQHDINLVEGFVTKEKREERIREDVLLGGMKANAELEGLQLREFCSSHKSDSSRETAEGPEPFLHPVFSPLWNISVANIEVLQVGEGYPGITRLKILIDIQGR